MIWQEDRGAEVAMMLAARGFLACCVFMGVASAEGALSARVLVEEEVYRFVPPHNGSGPLWSYGNTEIVRAADGRLYVSQMETGEGVPPLCNTRWRLLRRGPEGWELVAEPEGYRQREPAPVLVLGESILVSVNDSLEPPGAKYGRCRPQLLRFEPNSPIPARILPEWGEPPYFTDHSYRGVAADRVHNRLFMLHIDARTSKQHWAWIDNDGRTLTHGAIAFPIRACYPQVALRGDTAHVLAVGDIYEPVEEWRAYKFQQTQREWDYVFRKLFYAYAPDLAEKPFVDPLVIADVDATAGHLTNQDLWIGPDSEAYILYTEREVQSALIRDKFFPDKSIRNVLKLAVVKDGKVRTRHTLVEGAATSQPGCARFHEMRDGRVVAVVHLGGDRAGNYLMSVYPKLEPGTPVAIPLQRPFSNFCTATVRAGCAPSDTIDLLGDTGALHTLCYAEIRIKD